MQARTAGVAHTRFYEGLANADGAYGAAERHLSGEDDQASEDNGLEDATMEARDSAEDVAVITDAEERVTGGVTNVGGTSWQEDAAPEVQANPRGRESSKGR